MKNVLTMQDLDSIIRYSRRTVNRDHTKPLTNHTPGTENTPQEISLKAFSFSLSHYSNKYHHIPTTHKPQNPSTLSQ
jgi:hypothetical protein